MQRPSSLTLQESLRSRKKIDTINEEVENSEIVMTTLNGLPRAWDSFIQGICAKKKLVKFSILWEDDHKKKLEY